MLCLSTTKRVFELEQKWSGILKDRRQTHDDEVCGDRYRCHNQQQDHDDCYDPGASPPGPSVALTIPITITNVFTLLTGLLLPSSCLHSIYPPNPPKGWAVPQMRVCTVKNPLIYRDREFALCYLIIITQSTFSIFGLGALFVSYFSLFNLINTT